MFKVKSDIAHKIIKRLFVCKVIKFRISFEMTIFFRKKAINSDAESVSFLGPKIWDLVPSGINQYKTYNAFKSRIKRWVPDECPCRIIMQYYHSSDIFIIYF